ncbi:MAG: hypothetical protein CL504_06780 [Actinobacteria bacterium]|mgnify:CR=1 FL=1|nr:hypothetical protein [Actinomycetota bacterium]|tara:strand:- start:603 stop:1082 length:480 start_codon:yes stop_codon:yes gene_type:complete
MLAIVKSGAIESTGTLEQLFPNTSFPGGVAPDDFKTEEGIEEVVEGEQKDNNYYTVSTGNIVLVDGKPTQQYTNTAKDLGTLKVEKVSFVKDQASQRLSVTDWMIIRKVERDVAIPDATTTYRAEVVKECARLETAIAGASDVEALMTVMSSQNFPADL